MTPLLAVLLGWSLTQPLARAEIFGYRDSRGVIHFSNVHDDPRWIPLRVPPAQPARPLNHFAQEYPFAGIVTAQAVRHSIDPALIRAIIKVESDFDPGAKSSKGALGLMQLLPQTAQRYGPIDLFEPIENIRVGVRHLKQLLAQFRNDLRLTLAAYNAGSAAVTKHGGIPPFRETIEYIVRVLQHYQSYRTVQRIVEP